MTPLPGPLATAVTPLAAATLLSVLALGACSQSSSAGDWDAMGTGSNGTGSNATASHGTASDGPGSNSTDADRGPSVPSGHTTAPSSASGAPSSATPTTSASGPATAAGTWWKPPAGLSWQIQYVGITDTSVDADVYFLDGENTSAATVAALKAKGRRTVCYINAGATENWRTDKDAFPTRVVGAKMAGWSGERWLDIRHTKVLLPIMRARMEACKAKGFDGVDPDNVMGYEENTGFPLTWTDQLRYNKALASTAHSLGLAFGLKNDLNHLKELADTLDFAVNESCQRYNACRSYQVIVDRKKPVFHVEYKGTLESVCAQSPKGFSTILKTTDLPAKREACPPS